MPIPEHSIPRLLEGAALPPRGLAFLADRPGLWPYAAVPALLALLGAVVLFAPGVPVASWLLGLLWERPDPWYLSWLWLIARAAIWLVVLVIAVAALPTVLAAPALDVLSQQVEKIVLGAPGGPGGIGRMVAETWRGVTNALLRILRLALGHALLLLVLLVPVVNVAYPVLAFLWTARWTAIEYLDVTMARHLYRLSDVRAALRSVRPLGVGFGSVLALVLIVPLANLLVVPVGTVAGTLLYCSLVRAGKLPGRSTPTAAPLPASSIR